MRTAAIIFTSISISAGILSFAIPAEGVPAPPHIVVQCVNWVPTAAVQLAVASLVVDDKPPTPPDEIVPHPDKDKCPCKGTGTITHGDGHKTECPYHGRDSTPAPTLDPSKRCRCVTSKTYCNCKKVYGKCRCPTTTTQSNKSTQTAVDREAFKQQFKSTDKFSGLFPGFKRG